MTSYYGLPVVDFISDCFWFFMVFILYGEA